MCACDQIETRVNQIIVKVPDKPGNLMFTAGKLYLWPADQRSEKVSSIHNSHGLPLPEYKIIEYNTKIEIQMEMKSNELYWSKI